MKSQAVGDPGLSLGVCSAAPTSCPAQGRGAPMAPSAQVGASMRPPSLWGKFGDFPLYSQPLWPFPGAGRNPKALCSLSGLFLEDLASLRCHRVPHGPWDAVPEPSGSSPGALAQPPRSASPKMWLQKALSLPSDGHSMAHRNIRQILFHRGTGRRGGGSEGAVRCHPKASMSPGAGQSGCCQTCSRC